MRCSWAGRDKGTDVEHEGELGTVEIGAHAGSEPNPRERGVLSDYAEDSYRRSSADHTGNRQWPVGPVDRASLARRWSGFGAPVGGRWFGGLVAARKHFDGRCVVVPSFCRW